MLNADSTLLMLGWWDDARGSGGVRRGADGLGLTALLGVDLFLLGVESFFFTESFFLTSFFSPRI